MHTYAHTGVLHLSPSHFIAAVTETKCVKIQGWIFASSSNKAKHSKQTIIYAHYSGMQWDIYCVWTHILY